MLPPPPVARCRHEHFEENVPKLFAHGTVEDEIDPVVDQSEDVHEVTKREIHIVDEIRMKDAAQQVQNSLRKLREKEQSNHDQQHPCRSISVASTSWPSLITRRLPSQLLPPLLGLLHRPDEQDAEHCQAQTRNQLHWDRLDPEVEVCYGLVDVVLVFEGYHIVLGGFVSGSRFLVCRLSNRHGHEVRYADKDGD